VLLLCSLTATSSTVQNCTFRWPAEIRKKNSRKTGTKAFSHHTNFLTEQRGGKCPPYSRGKFNISVLRRYSSRGLSASHCLMTLRSTSLKHNSEQLVSNVRTKPFAIKKRELMDTAKDASCLCFQSESISSFFMMDASESTEPSINFCETKRCHIPEDSHRHETLMYRLRKVC
jgi:hypothetical protein